MAKGIKRKVMVALTAVNTEITRNAVQNSRFSAGLSGEGYAGGYRDALNDVLLLLNGVTPNNNRGYWEGLRKPRS